MSQFDPEGSLNEYLSPTVMTLYTFACNNSRKSLKKDYFTKCRNKYLRDTYTTSAVGIFVFEQKIFLFHPNLKKKPRLSVNNDCACASR